MLSPNNTFTHQITTWRIVSHAVAWLSVSFLLLPPGGAFAARNEEAVASAHREPPQADSASDTRANQLGGSAVPRLSLDKVTHDFGKMSPNSRNSATFQITNSGGGALRIMDVKTCCGTVVKLDKKELSPGDSTALWVEVTTSEKAGTMANRIRLVTNDPGRPYAEVTIEGTVIETLRWTPTKFDLSPFGGDMHCPDIRIEGLDGDAFSITGFASTGDAITASFDPNATATEFILKPTIDMTRFKKLTIPTGSIMVSLSHADYKRITVAFNVVQPMEAKPAQILVFGAKADEPIVETVQLQDNQIQPNAGVAIEIASVTARNGSRVALRGVTPNKTGCDLNLEIWPARDKETEAFSSDQLVVRLKDGRELTVPLRVFYQVSAVSGAAGPSSNL